MITPSPSVSWEASGGLNAGGEGSDQQIAVSSTHVGVSGRAVLAFYDKSGAKVYGVTGAEAFFIAQGLPTAKGGYGIFDLRMIFDEYRKRFWVGALTGKPGPGSNVQSFLCAVSKTQNPLDGFYLYWWDAVPTAAGSGYAPGDGADYPCIGIAQHVFVQTNKVAGASYKHWRVVLRNADKMAQGLPGAQINGWEWWGWNNPDGNKTYIIQPAVHHGPSARVFLVNKWNNHAEVWAIDNPLTPSRPTHAPTCRCPALRARSSMDRRKGIWWPHRRRSPWGRRSPTPSSKRSTEKASSISRRTIPRIGAAEVTSPRGD